jgi:hypothetical protein
LQHFGIAGEAFRDRLDRDLAVQLTVKRAIDQTHPAATEKIDHLVFSDALYVGGSHGN